MNPAVLPLLVTLLNKFFPGGAAKAKEPSTVVGLAELAAVIGAGLAHFELAPDLAEPVSLVVLGLLSVYNIIRRERGVAHD
jgi:hypothetical protein